MSNLQNRIEKVEAQTLGALASPPEEIIAIEAIARCSNEMEAAGATADEVIAEIERARN